MKRILFSLSMVGLLASPALAQQEPQLDPNKIIAALQGQRNAALDSAAAFEARARALADERDALKKQIVDLAKKPADPPPEK